ncbi:MAG: nickel/cobalt transporter [Leptolyngbyaceae cyanobacterium]
MMRKLRRYGLLSFLAGLGSILFWCVTAGPSLAHWADLAAAKVVVADAEVQITLTYPTELTTFADGDGNGHLSADEIDQHNADLRTFLENHIRLSDGDHQGAIAKLQAGEQSTSPMALSAPASHTTLQLTYTWPDLIQDLRIDYTLFVPNAPKARCLATILQGGQFTTHVFTPQETTLVLMPESTGSGAGAWLLPLIGAFAWGAVHSMSPGHGKTLIGAYLVGERATPLHAIFLAMTTTITHTLGVVALGLVTLFAARYILPEQLYPWLSLISGSLVIVIGLNLFWQRSHRPRRSGSESEETSLHVHSHKHEHSHRHSHAHADHTHAAIHAHHGHTHSHLPPETDGKAVTWRSLLLLGLSGGLVPCPAALVLLLGAIAVGNPASGLVLVLMFSLGLASVLTGLGLLLVYAKQIFKRLPTSRLPFMQWLPVMSAVGITAIGVGISTQSLWQIV